MVVLDYSKAEPKDTKESNARLTAEAPGLPPHRRSPFLSRLQGPLPPRLARALSLDLPLLGLQPRQPPFRRHLLPPLLRSAAGPETRSGGTLFPTPGSLAAPPIRFRPAMIGVANGTGKAEWAPH